MSVGQADCLGGNSHVTKTSSKSVQSDAEHLGAVVRTAVMLRCGNGLIHGQAAPAHGQRKTALPHHNLYSLQYQRLRPTLGQVPLVVLPSSSRVVVPVLVNFTESQFATRQSCFSHCATLSSNASHFLSMTCCSLTHRRGIF